MPAQLTLYEKKTCITCQKALAFLQDNNIAFDAVDIVKNPPPKALLERVLDESNLKAAMNPRSSIYKERQLGKISLSKSQVLALMLEDPNLIKRPFMVKNNKDVYQGFDPDTLNQFLRDQS